MSQLISVASFQLFLNETGFVVGDDDRLNTLVNAVNDGVRAVVTNSEDPEVLWLALATDVWRAVMAAHAQHGLGEDSGWIQCKLYQDINCVLSYHDKARFARHERLRFRAFMHEAHKRCAEWGVGGVVHRVSLGGYIYWEGTYRLGEKHPHRVCCYEDGGGISWVLFDRKLGQRKSR